MNININSYDSSTSFQYNSILKDMFRAGKLPGVTHGLYGNKLTKKNLSIEHMKPHSKGGKNVLSNYALADKYVNSARGSEDIKEYLTPDMAKRYFVQFKDLIVNFKDKIFNGNDYIRNCLRTLDKLGVHVDLKV